MSTKETTKQRSGSFGVDGIDLDRSFRVITDDPTDGPLVAQQAVLVTYSIYMGQPYGEGSNAYALNIEEHQRADNRLVWDVVVRYGVRGYSAGDAVQNPLARPLDISVETALYTKTLEHDLDGKPILNTAGQPFDPGLEITISRPRLIAVQNEPTEPYDKIWDFDNTINNAAYKGAAAGRLRVRMRASRMYENAMYFWRVSYEFEYHSAGWQSEGRLLSVGMCELVHISGQQDEWWEWRRLKDKTGELIADPVPLDDLGRALDPDDIKEGTATFHYLDFRVYEERNFNELYLVWERHQR